MWREITQVSTFDPPRESTDYPDRIEFDNCPIYGKQILNLLIKPEIKTSKFPEEKKTNDSSNEIIERKSKNQKRRMFSRIFKWKF